MNADQAKALREPFGNESISLLPKVTCKRCTDSQSKNCSEHQKRKCQDCGAWITTAHLHLSYVGHAETTDRFLEVDPEWTWEPLAFDQQGLPAFDRHGGLWLRLTIAGVARLGYGDAQGKQGPNAVKEAIGDGLRNAGMRFGVALHLWAKSDLAAVHADKETGDIAGPAPKPADEAEPHANGNGRRTPPDASQASRARILKVAKDRGWTPDDIRLDYAATHNDEKLDEASAESLAAYAELLETGAVAS